MRILEALFKNSSPLQTLTKNSFWIVFGRVSSGVLRAILVIYSARILGVNNFGSFTLGMNYIMIFSFLPEFGFTAILTRELAKRELDSQKVFSSLFIITLLFSFFTYIFILGFSGIFIKDTIAIAIIPILGLMMIFDVLREFSYGVFRAEEKMEKQGLLHFFTNLILFGIGMFVLLTPELIAQKLYYLAYAYLFSVFIGTIIGFTMIWKYIKNLKLKIDLPLYVKFFNSSWPIALANFIFLLLLYIDSIILGWFHSAHFVGLYNATVKLNEFLIFFPQAIALAIFPMLSRSLNEPEKLKYYLELGLKLGAILMFPIVFGVFILGSNIVSVIYGSQYIATIPALKIIIFSMLGAFPFLILTNLLIALDKRRELLAFDALLILINVGLNILLIPKFHYYAAAYVTTLTNLLGFLFAYFISQKYVKFEFNKLLVKPFIASLIMAIILLFAKNMSLLLVIPLGAIVYLVMLLLIKEELTTKALNRRIVHK